jgi:uncharacterized protein YecT (DUF1311 family)
MSNTPDSCRFGTLALAIALVLLPAPVIAQELGEGGEDTLILSTAMCDADTIAMAGCLDRQKQKADRWLDTIVESAARQASEAMVDMAHGGSTFDQVAQLRRSQTAFEQYRAEMSELVKNYGLVGSINKLQAARTYFELTIDRAHLLLGMCASKHSIKGNQSVDLSRVDWCPPAL